MNYDEFKEYVTSHMKEWFPEDRYDISIRKIVKNNGLILDGLCIFEKGETSSPTLYLESYYTRYQNGGIMADVLAAIQRDYERGKANTPVMDTADPSYETVRSRIIMRLVNYEKNREILKDCPYLALYDLAITFRWLAHQDDIGISTALITNREMERWNVTTEKLYEDASANTPRLFPGKIIKLETMIEDYGVSAPKGTFDLYVLTNDQGINGATCILYHNLLESFAKTVDDSFYLLPSSIHEMMICLAENAATEKMLLSLVRDANHMVVTMGEVLSDNIYYYNKHTGKISLIQNIVSTS